MSDQQIEQEIIAKGKTAPRVTPADIEANIVSTWYFTAGDAIDRLPLRPVNGGDAFPGIEYPLLFAPEQLHLLTFCVLVLRNGFTVTGESACASPENFDAEIGRKAARDNAIQKIWPLMGYALKQQLSDQANVAQKPAPGAAYAGYSKMQPHQQRVVDELAELDVKIAALDKFAGTAIYASLPIDEQTRMAAQSDAMKVYSNVLLRRIAAFN